MLSPPTTLYLVFISRAMTPPTASMPRDSSVTQMRQSCLRRESETKCYISSTASRVALHPPSPNTTTYAPKIDTAVSREPLRCTSTASWRVRCLIRAGSAKGGRSSPSSGPLRLVVIWKMLLCSCMYHYTNTNHSSWTVPMGSLWVWCALQVWRCCISSQTQCLVSIQSLRISWLWM